MKLFARLILILMVLGNAACSTLFKVESDPVDAEVFVRGPDPASERKQLGRTPLSMTTSELEKNLGAAVKPGEFFTVTVEKPGFESQSFNLPASQFGTTVTQLNVKMRANEAKKEMKNAKDIIEQLFLAQRFALSNQLERALIEVDKILEKFPDFARALSMKGSIYFAQKNYNESLKWYEEALKADPQLEETVKMAAKVRAALGGRVPATAPGSSQ